MRSRTSVYPSFEGAHLVSETPGNPGGCRPGSGWVDENLIEIYINDGEYVISNAVYGIGKAITVSGANTIQLFTMAE